MSKEAIRRLACGPPARHLQGVRDKVMAGEMKLEEFERWLKEN